MKKHISPLMAAVLCALLLTACGAVSEVEEAIDQIGTVSIESLDRIEKAEALYDALSDSQKNRVENRYALTTARKEYDRMAGAIEAAREAIQRIGSVTLDSFDAILAAREAYNALEYDDLSNYVSDELPTLIYAENQYIQLLHDNGVALLGEKNYAEARDAFDLLLEYFPGSMLSDSAFEKAAEALYLLAQQTFQTGKLEETYYSLQEMESLYGLTENAVSLKTQLQQRLDAKRPYNGQVFTNTAGWGYGEFSVKTSDRDAYIKLESLDDPAKYILFYARAGEEAKVNVKDGQYIAKYATGTQWFDQEVLFGRDTSYTRAEDVMDLTTTYEGGYVYYQAISITLYSVIGGDLETTDINASQF